MIRPNRTYGAQITGNGNVTHHHRFTSLRDAKRWAESITPMHDGWTSQWERQRVDGTVIWVLYRWRADGRLVGRQTVLVCESRPAGRGV